VAGVMRSVGWLQVVGAHVYPILPIRSNSSATASGMRNEASEVPATQSSCMFYHESATSAMRRTIGTNTIALTVSFRSFRGAAPRRPSNRR
jgi:hypothetical protein